MVSNSCNRFTGRHHLPQQFWMWLIEINFFRVPEPFLCSTSTGRCWRACWKLIQHSSSAETSGQSSAYPAWIFESDAFLSQNWTKMQQTTHCFQGSVASLGWTNHPCFVPRWILSIGTGIEGSWITANSRSISRRTAGETRYAYHGPDHKFYQNCSVLTTWWSIGFCGHPTFEITWNSARIFDNRRYLPTAVPLENGGQNMLPHLFAKLL